MKEESQIDDMRAAIRGDRERAEQARQRSTEKVRALIERTADEPEREPASAPAPAPAPSVFRKLFGR